MLSGSDSWPAFLLVHASHSTTISRTRYSHVVVLTQGAEVLVQLLHPLLMCLDALALQPLVQLQKSYPLANDLRKCINEPTHPLSPSLLVLSLRLGLVPMCRHGPSKLLFVALLPPVYARLAVRIVAFVFVGERALEGGSRCRIIVSGGFG